MVFILFIFVVLTVPTSAAGSADDDIINKAQSLNVTVPQKGTALPGTKESMTEMMEWLNACVDAILSLVHDVMNVLGISNTTYAQDMTKTLEQGKTMSQGGIKK
ncbi:MAG: hypothetical protein OS112_08150 [Methanoregula sp.]|nr:MAG: hypothetical protein OS112_08150 [Methanoregula sp.]